MQKMCLRLLPDSGKVGSFTHNTLKLQVKFTNVYTTRLWFQATKDRDKVTMKLQVIHSIIIIIIIIITIT